MFSRFAKSAKSAMEETFLMITDKCIIEFKSSRLNIGSGTGEIVKVRRLSRVYVILNLYPHISSLNIILLKSHICNKH